jgi:hypothetical protein
VTLHDGAYGPYVKHGKVNASLPEGQDADALTLEQALALIAARAEAKGVRSSARKGAARGGKRGAKAGAKGAGAKGGAKAGARGRAKGASKGGARAQRAAKPAKPKATPADLEPFLDQLDPGDRAVVAPIDGIGVPKESLVSVTERLGLAQEDAEAALKRARFKLRMAYGKARKADA